MNGCEKPPNIAILGIVNLPKEGKFHPTKIVVNYRSISIFYVFLYIKALLISRKQMKPGAADFFVGSSGFIGLL